MLEPRGTTRDHLGPKVVPGAQTPEQYTNLDGFGGPFWKVFLILFATVGGICSKLLSDGVFDDI